MKIVCSSNMPFAEEAFSTLGDTVLKTGRDITADDVRDAEILATRSTTKINRELLENSSVRFAGTATIGVDHIDIPYLKERGISWCYSPGCNANSVAEYLTSALLCLADLHAFTLEGMTIGIIGVGNVGSRVARKAKALGLRILKNDPPRERAGDAESFVSLDEILAESDIVTLHVPLTHTGQDATDQMADKAFFESMKPGAIFINSARGQVAVTHELLAAMASNIVQYTVIDTWEGEPAYCEDLARRADIGTPHIAGYSFEGKVMGTLMVYQEACRFLGIEPTWTPEGALPQPAVPQVECDLAGEKGLWQIVRQVYNVQGDDRGLRAGPGGDDRATHFDSLRRNYPIRREFPSTRVILQGNASELRDKVAGLGFAIV